MNDGGRSLTGMFQEKIKTVKFETMKIGNFLEQFCYKGKERNAAVTGGEGE